MTADLLVDNYHIPNKIRALIGYFYNNVPLRPASPPPAPPPPSPPTPPNKENGHGNQVDLKYCRDKKRPGDLTT